MRLQYREIHFALAILEDAQIQGFFRQIGRVGLGIVLSDPKIDQES